MIYFKVHKAEKGDLIAMCDEELLGKVLTEGKMELDLKTYAEFYKGDLLSEEKAKASIVIDTIYSANVVGKQSVKVMMDKGLVGEADVRMVADVPFVQLFTMV
ncbi:MAG: DUF424 family protein [Candidatus Micrarchaeota archaeon]|nr:DUF424 family protein [Candidatus Micrarchaeota archaeon]MDE1804432.1 DUF424 family protein [Candidatus Micrarchaeota archaeon]MDE1847200.1 DUF424 family protein [Candidatus Micrarchaeota archaeon]